MKKRTITLSVTTFLFLANNIFSQSSWFPDYVPTIPADRRVDWHNVGDKQIPSSYDKIFNVLNYGAIPNDGTDDRQAIQNAIDAAKVYNSLHPGSFCAVYLPRGTYYITSGTLSLINDQNNNYSNICLKGDGSDKTLLFYYFTGNTSDKAIFIKGYTPPIYQFNDVTQGYNRNSNVVTTNTSGISAGDYIELVDDRPVEWGQSIGQIDKVTYVSPTQLTLDDSMAIDYNYNNNRPQLRKILPIQNVGIEDLQILRQHQPIGTGFQGDYTIYFNYAANCWVLGVESVDTYSRHVVINASTGIEVRGSYFHEATDYTGGHGYGVEIENHSTDCLVEDNIFSHLRHSMMVQAGANRNVFAYNYSWDRVWDSYP